MSIRDSTKQQLASALRELIEHAPFEKVSVTQICDQCSCPRQTFYYHFKDKYDLAAWIFAQDWTGALMESTISENFTERTMALLVRMQTNREFYRSAFRTNMQNSLRGYIITHNTNMFLAHYEEVFGTQPTVELIAKISFAFYGGVQVTIDWLMGKIDLSPEQLATVLHQCMMPLLSSEEG